jgi:hypothetical protein
VQVGFKNMSLCVRAHFHFPTLATAMCTFPFSNISNSNIISKSKILTACNNIITYIKCYIKNSNNINNNKSLFSSSFSLSVPQVTNDGWQCMALEWGRPHHHQQSAYGQTRAAPKKVSD